MPFKSQAQRRKFAQLMVQGKVSPQTFEEWNRETGSAKLPEHAARKAPKKKTAKRKTAKKTAKKKTGRRRSTGKASVRKRAR